MKLTKLRLSKDASNRLRFLAGRNRAYTKSPLPHWVLFVSG
jgi:hypothetical protein